ncbi:hypothetical protein SAMN04487969_11920 [Paenibacillus algorifonticola]|uniref:Uncharacterized protein n=2 Tax=Paenibacillus algorifonticola TaxID=684063 RepID=A0A1I2H160_9BACL|nr:hypothetical protein SAMN04487969_11920 [Paenibacillus algorifonticola]
MHFDVYKRDGDGGLQSVQTLRSINSNADHLQEALKITEAILRGEYAGEGVRELEETIAATAAASR